MMNINGNYILQQNNETVQTFEITDHIYTLCKDFIDITRSVTNLNDITLDVTEPETMGEDHCNIPDNIGKLLSKINPYIIDGCDMPVYNNILMQMGIKQSIITASYLNSLQAYKYKTTHRILIISGKNINSVVCKHDILYVPFGIRYVIIDECCNLNKLTINTDSCIYVHHCNTLNRLIINTYEQLPNDICISSSFTLYKHVNIHDCKALYELNINTKGYVNIRNCESLYKLSIYTKSYVNIHNCISLYVTKINANGYVNIYNCISLVKLMVNTTGYVYVHKSKLQSIVLIKTEDYVCISLIIT